MSHGLSLHDQVVVTAVASHMNQQGHFAYLHQLFLSFYLGQIIEQDCICGSDAIYETTKK